MPAPNWSILCSDPSIQRLIALAVQEDLGDGDLTTESIFDDSIEVVARLVTRRATVVCGSALVATILERVDPSSNVAVDIALADGEAAAAGALLITLSGRARTILSAERIILNFLMRLCGVAHSARRAVEALPQGSRARIYDTRKTVPGWRLLDKAAVATGGAVNHRIGLFDSVIIKDNHIAAAGGILEAVRCVRARVDHHIEIEVEVDTLQQLDSALEAAPDVILLDNFSLPMLETAVRRSSGRVLLEASGGVTLDTIPAIAKTGVDRISMGALTHSAPPADLALDFPGSP